VYECGCKVLPECLSSGCLSWSLQVITPSLVYESCTWKPVCMMCQSSWRTQETPPCTTHLSSRWRCARATRTATAPPSGRWLRRGWARAPSSPSWSASSFYCVSTAGVTLLGDTTFPILFPVYTGYFSRAMQALCQGQSHELWVAGGGSHICIQTSFAAVSAKRARALSACVGVLFPRLSVALQTSLHPTTSCM